MSYLVVPRRGDSAGSPNISALDPAMEDRRRSIAAEVAAAVASLRAQAEAEGRAKGEAAGRQDAQAQASAGLSTAVTALREAWSQLAAPLAQKEHDLAELVTDLSFELARHIVGAEVSANAGSLKSLVAKLILEAAAERQPRQSIVVRLNPEDHVLLSPAIQLDDGHLMADAAIARGGAIVEIVAPGGDPNDKIEWDATIGARIESIRAALALHSGTGAEHEAAP
jgi:flagellar assembly protein FliH